MVVQMMTSYNNDFKFKLDRIKDLIDPRFLIESLGFKIHRETIKELRGACIIHGGDNLTSFRFNKERKTWVCFSHKCHETFGNDVIGLVRSVLNIDFMSAINFLDNFVGNIDSSCNIMYKIQKEKEEFIHYNKVNEEYIHPDVNEDRLLKFRSIKSNYFLQQGFSYDTLEHFEVAGNYKCSDGVLRDIIPIRNTDGKLVAYSFRDTRKNVSFDNKYMLTPNFNKDKVLYNFCNSKLLLNKVPLILVEGFKAVWKLWECGIENVAACMGSYLTSGQTKLVYQYAIKGVVLFFDSDISGVEGMHRIYNILKDKIDISIIYIVEKDLDPADLSCDKNIEYLNYKFI